MTEKSETDALFKEAKEKLEKDKIRIKEITLKIKSELEPFLDGIITKRANYELFKQAYNDFQTRYKGARAIFRFIMKDSLKAFQFRPLAETYMLFVYLGLVESLGNSIVNIITMLLVANGKDFHIECMHPPTPRIRHAVSFEDLEIERVPMTAKLNFLRGNGITELASLIDTDLRNDIAHSKFSIKEDRVYVKGKPALELITDSMLLMIVGFGIVEELLVLPHFLHFEVSNGSYRNHNLNLRL